MTVQYLLKFGTEEYMERLLTNGEFYAKPLVDFKKAENHKRYDLQEGLSEVIHFTNDSSIQLRANEQQEWKTLNVTKGQLNGWLDATAVHNYSLYYISEDQTRQQAFYPIPGNMKAYGDFYVLIKNPREFISRVKNALDKAGLTYAHGCVHYYDPNANHRSLGYFHKKDTHMDEQEFRFIIKSRSPDPTILYLGDMTDIAELLHINQHAGFHFIWDK
jgi:hypothetical protein